MAVSKALRFQILRRDGHACRYCGRTAPEVKLTVDHVVATALGGGDEPENLVTACSDCNGGKSATPADAAIVAQVSEDALRWARARAAAAEKLLAEHDLRAESHDQFLEKWNSWTAGGKPLELPPSWPQDVDRFLGYGLPMPLLLESVDIAMNGKNIRHDAIYKYMCGVLWNKVRKIDEMAAAEVSPQETGEPETTVAALVHHLLGDDRHVGLREMVEHALEVGRTDAAQTLMDYIDDLLNQRDALVKATSDLVYSLNDDLIAEVKADHEDAIARRWTLGNEAAGAVGALEYLRYWNNMQVLLELGEEHAEGWTDVAKTFWAKFAPAYEADRFSLAELAAELFSRYTETGELPDWLCRGPGRGGATCPRRATYLVEFDPCDECQQGCVGHLMWCEDHVTQAVDGELTKEGKPYTIAEFTEDTVD